MGAEAEADQVGVVVDGDAHVLVDRPDESRNLKKELVMRQVGYLDMSKSSKQSQPTIKTS